VRFVGIAANAPALFDASPGQSFAAASSLLGGDNRWLQFQASAALPIDQ
jgi:hypothetical protein